MQKLRVMKGVFVRTRAYRVLYSFLMFFFLGALVIWLADPGIESYGRALWYCYAVVSTVGFGDVVAGAFITRIISVLLTVYGLFALAILTGVIVNAYTQMIQIQQRETLAAYADKLEHLPELSREELEELSRGIRKFRKTMPKK